MQLNFGRTKLTSSSGHHTLGRFECSGQVSPIGMPKSCKDLWRIGHTKSGLYSVMEKEKVESVYCDFSKLPTDSGKSIRWNISFVSCVKKKQIDELHRHLTVNCRFRDADRRRQSNRNTKILCGFEKQWTRRKRTLSDYGDGKSGNCFLWFLSSFQRPE